MSKLNICLGGNLPHNVSRQESQLFVFDYEARNEFFPIDFIFFIKVRLYYFLILQINTGSQVGFQPFLNIGSY
jgi:hypothetical protein